MHGTGGKLGEPPAAEKLVDMTEVGVALLGPVHGNVADTVSVKEGAQEVLDGDGVATALLRFVFETSLLLICITDVSPEIGTNGIPGVVDGEADGKL